MIYLNGSFAGPQIVLNGGAATVKAKPIRGRLDWPAWRGAPSGALLIGGVSAGCRWRAMDPNVFGGRSR
jgi:hypothetical protein